MGSFGTETLAKSAKRGALGLTCGRLPRIVHAAEDIVEEILSLVHPQFIKQLLVMFGIKTRLPKVVTSAIKVMSIPSRRNIKMSKKMVFLFL